MEKEVPENILAKIRKLLRLKESAIKIGSEGEAHAAAEAVNRLLTSYNLSLMDVTPEEQKNFLTVPARYNFCNRNSPGIRLLVLEV